MSPRYQKISIMVNEVTLIGRAGKDPEVRRLENGAAVAKFSVATSKTYRDHSGEKVTSVEWHNVTVWRNLAEICERYLKKGNLVYIKGELTTTEYKNKDDVRIRATVVTANMVRILEPKPSNNWTEDDELDDLPY